MVNYSATTVELGYNSNNFNSCGNYFPKYSNVRCIDLEEISKINRLINATFSEDGKYYITSTINNISDKEVIMQLYNYEKFFGAEENEARDRIIEKTSVKHQDNFFDYYD